MGGVINVDYYEGSDLFKVHDEHFIKQVRNPDPEIQRSRVSNGERPVREAWPPLFCLPQPVLREEAEKWCRYVAEYGNLNDGEICELEQLLKIYVPRFPGHPHEHFDPRYTGIINDWWDEGGTVLYVPVRAPKGRKVIGYVALSYENDA